MKYITMEQFNKASNEVQYKILDWWKPSDGDLMYNLETKEREVFEPSYIDVDCTHSHCVPLLTEGQLIEFIEEITECKIDIMYSYIGGGYTIFIDACNFKTKNNNLLQTLWEILNKLINKGMI